MTQDTTPTSGAADLRATFSEMLVDLPNTEPYTLFKAGFDAALAAGQATAQQATAQQAAEPVALLVRKNSWRDGQWEVAPPNSPSYGLAWANQRMYVYATQQPTQPQAGAVPLTDEYPALVCDYCGALTPDPWHSSGMLHGKMSKHIHSCDACASHWQAPATQQAGATKEHVRLVRVIADKIEDGTLFRSGIYSNKDLARFVRNVADAAAPQFPTTQAADSVTAPAPPPECETEAEKRAFAFGWFKALEAERMKADNKKKDPL